MIILQTIVLGFGCLVGLLLLFWQISTIISVFLGAPAISSPVTEGWQKFADKRKSFMDLGCGNGTVCLRAAPYFKQVYGIEGSPWFYLVSRWRTRRVPNITILFGNFFWRPWPKVDYIYCYLLVKVIRDLKPRLVESGATILSLSFAIEGWKPDQVLKDHHRTLYVYRPKANES